MSTTEPSEYTWYDDMTPNTVDGQAILTKPNHGQVGQEPLLKRLSLDRLLFPRLSKAATALGQYTRYYTEKRIKQRNDVEADKEAVRERGYEDILAHLINNKDDETGSIYSPDELLGEATLLMMAGNDVPLGCLRDRQVNN
jgi:cytochrome P450